MVKNNLLMLETNDASISTATVTIKALQVGKKQMTQSVFRQLPEAVLVDTESLILAGIPWGWVNYHWGQIGDHKTHFIFQLGSRLFRNAFWIRPSNRINATSDYKESSTYQAMIDKLMLGIEAYHFTSILNGTFQRKNYSWEARYSCPELDIEFTVSGIPHGADSIRMDDAERARIFHREREQAIDNFKKAIISRVGSELTSDAISQRNRATINEAVDYRRRWDDLMQQLRGVEQLFIAV